MGTKKTLPSFLNERVGGGKTITGLVYKIWRTCKMSPFGQSHIMRFSALLLAPFCAALFVTSPLQASERKTLGVYGNWAAFRDDDEPRCYAIAKPFSTHGTPQFKSYASIGYWPNSRIFGQFYVRLSKPLGKGRELRLTVGERRFILRGNAMHGWAGDPRMDAAILTALRSSENMRVHGTTESGGTINDIYELRGAATAADAAALGCARQG